MDQLREIDIAILLIYLTGVVGLGCWLSRLSCNTEQYIVADRSLPAWAVGLSIFGSYISSISFLANPGKSFGGNWNAFVFSLATPVAALVAVRWFVPFYRRTGHVSAYEHLETRFGPWARSYAAAHADGPHRHDCLPAGVGRVPAVVDPLPSRTLARIADVVSQSLP